MLLKRSVLIIMTTLIAVVSLSSVQAGMVSNEQIIEKVHQQIDKDTLLQAMHRTEVKEQLASLGVSSAELETRINQMTHAEITQLNSQMADMPAGAGDVLGVFVTLLVIFVITDVLGATDIFPFIRPIT